VFSLLSRQGKYVTAFLESNRILILKIKPVLLLKSLKECNIFILASDMVTGPNSAQRPAVVTVVCDEFFGPACQFPG